MTSSWTRIKPDLANFPQIKICENTVLSHAEIITSEVQSAKRRIKLHKIISAEVFSYKNPEFYRTILSRTSMKIFSVTKPHFKQKLATQTVIFPSIHLNNSPWTFPTKLIQSRFQFSAKMGLVGWHFSRSRWFVSVEDASSYVIRVRCVCFHSSRV